MSNHDESICATVVLLDDTLPSAHAVDWAVERARHCGELIVVRHAQNRSRSSEPNQADRAIVAERLRLEDQVAGLRADFPGLRLSGKLVDGDLFEDLADLSNSSTLIVVGTHDRRSSSFAFARSIGGRLAAIAHGPVAVVPESAPIQVDSILVGVDGSASSTAAAEFAANEASMRELDLTVVHAWQEPMAWHDVYAPPNDEFVRELEEAHRLVLDDAIALIRGQRPNLTVHGQLVCGPAQWTLLDAAGKSGLLVVGAHGLNRVKVFLLGSVSHAIVLNLQSTVIIVPAIADH